MAKTATARKFTLLPNHIALVPDGNGRWAERRGLPRLNGHRVGAENMYRMVEYLNEYPIKYVTLYGFSTENWARPEDEVDGFVIEQLERVRTDDAADIILSNGSGVSVRI